MRSHSMLIAGWLAGWLFGAHAHASYVVGTIYFYNMTEIMIIHIFFNAALTNRISFFSVILLCILKALMICTPYIYIFQNMFF